MTLWGIHNTHPELDLVGNGFISIGWEELGDLTGLSDDREALKVLVASIYPTVKPGAIPGWAGTLLRFRWDMKVGDMVIFPYKPDRTLNFGRIATDYYYEADAALQPSRRRVEWIKTGVPRAGFSPGARYEVGAATTLFRVRNHTAEFLSFIESSETTAPGAPAETLPDLVSSASDGAESDPSPERIDEYTRGFIVKTLLDQVDGFEFEELVGDLLRAMGYRARVTQATGDAGVDVIAHRDPLGLEPPIIKVQCKRITADIGRPQVQGLVGALASNHQELGLFVTLGSYNRDAKALGRERGDLRLIDGDELVDLIFEHYDSLGPSWKRLLPLRRMYVVDREPENA